MAQEALNILLADDDEDDRIFFKEAFSEIKIKSNVETVNDGVELMNYLHTHESNLPHILFLDLNMPKKSGFECLREIRNSEKLKHLTVAIYSTSGSESDIEETLAQGANVYIKKPYDFQTLKKVLSNVVSIKWQYHTNGLNKENFILSV